MNNLRRSIFNRILEKCEKNKITKEIGYFIIKIGLGDFVYRLCSKKYLNDRIEFYKANEKRIIENINIFADEESKSTYKNLIRYRCERKRKYFPKEYKGIQYFCEDIVKVNDNEVFIDCGAFTGDTVEVFLEKCKNKYKKVVCFEPDKSNFEEIKENTKEIPNISVNCYGVYSKNDVLKFDSSNTISSAISNVGEEKIEVISLDQFEACKDATFIKMDIEGSELDALKGAQNIIKNNKPKLAICIYHSDQDMIDIIEYIHNIEPEYKIYLRHHSLYEAETVVYCV